MICPKCGEVNSSNFLFCGMCGTILEPARRATAAVQPPAPRIVESQTPAKTPQMPVAQPATPPPPRASVNEPTPPISGPSLLGLDQSNVEDIRERAFSGLASYGRSDEPKGAGKEILLTIVLVAALAGAGWWTYKNYVRVAGNPKPAPAASTPSETANTASENPATQPTEKVNVKDIPAERSSEEANPAAANVAPAKPPVETPPSAETKEATETEPESTPKTVTPTPTPARHEVSATRIPAKPAPPAQDSGDALFRRGQAYLYGRNGTGDCANALKYLKMASDQQNAKARSMMGTMYATGHCVSRDLPSSYRWFALALRVDPNNTVLEKNLSGVWNQMTPPERQMATKSQ